MSRPDAGIGHYLRDIVYGASDGVVTTLAVIAGVAGAQFSPRVALVLGAANLVADGMSMAVSNYLGLKSELEQNGVSPAIEKPGRHGFATFGAFVIAGAIPLATFAIAIPGTSRFQVAFVLGLVTLAVVGGARSRFVSRPVWRCALEMMVLAGGACALAYVLGAGIESLV